MADLGGQFAEQVCAGEGRVGAAERLEVRSGDLRAGFETTVNLISNSVLALLAHPEQWQALCADPEGMAPRAVEETLRFDPPVQLTTRIALQPLELEGKPVRKGQMVLTLTREEDGANRRMLLPKDGHPQGQPRYAMPTSCSWEVPVMVGPGDEIAAGAGGRHGRLRASHADREQVIDVLTAAFVQGRLTKDEFDLRVGQALASRTYADLGALTTDLPARPTAAQPPKPTREPNRPTSKKLIARATATGPGASLMIIAMAIMASGRNPVLGLVAGAMLSCFAAVLRAGLLTFLSWVLEKGFNRQPAQGSPPSATS